MSAPGSRRSVLLACLEPIARVGMREVLEDGGFDVDDANGDGDGDVVARAADARPYAIVLGLDDPSVHDLGRRVQAVAPDTTVILWPRDERWMEVFEPGAHVPRRAPSGTHDALIGELESAHWNPDKE